MIPFLKSPKKEELKRIQYEAELDLAQYLTSYGFTTDEAIKASRDFWRKHKEKLKRIL